MVEPESIIQDMHTEVTVVSWPAILKLEGDSELTYFASQAQWNDSDDVHQAIYSDEDMLIDVTGKIFKLLEQPTQASLSMPEPVPSSSTIQLRSDNTSLYLDQICDLIKLHQSCIGDCCIAKISFPSIKHAIQSLAPAK